MSFSRKITILYSGGLDSFIMYKYAQLYTDAKINCVYYDIGHGYAKKEIATLPDFVEVRSVDWMKGQTEAVGKDDSNSGNIIIPGRNMLLATLAVCHYLPDEVWLGALAGEAHAGSTDKNDIFRKRFNDLAEYVFAPFYPAVKIPTAGYTITRKPTLVFPLLQMNWSKLDIVEWGLKHGITAQEMMKTSSCLSDEDGNCGQCVVCMRRWGIFTQLGFSEKYNKHPYEEMTESNRQMILAMIENELEPFKNGHYDKHRRDEIIPGVIRYTGKSLVELKDDLSRNRQS